MKDLNAKIGQLTLLKDRLRRSMYLFARRNPTGVTREEVARELGVSRRLAAFHLDKLADEGLVEFHYARPPGRSGPGAGRPAKVYRPIDPEIEVSLPERRYDLMGALLTDSIAGGTAQQTDEAKSVAYRKGFELGQDVKKQQRLRPPGAERAISIATKLLGEYGFEPRENDGELSLMNCPFYALSQRSPELVCALNHSFLEGIVRGLGNQTLDVALMPAKGQCCVRIRSNNSRGDRRS